MISWIWYQRHKQQMEQQTGLHENCKILYIRRHHQQSKKANHEMGENICKSHIWYGINSHNIQRTLKTQNGAGKGNPLQYSCLENFMNRGDWQVVVHGVAKSRIGLSDFTFTFHFHALEKKMATHSSVLTWRIPGTAEPGGLPSMESHRVHDWSDLAAAVTKELGSCVSSSKSSVLVTE